MNYDELVSTALKKTELKKLLCGEKPYQVEVSKFTSDVFPTDVNAVLVNCVYKQTSIVLNIREYFEDCLHEMLAADAAQVYIAILYLDACVYQEERGKATFNIEKEIWAKYIRSAVNQHRNELEQDIYFANGLKKNNALKNIHNFSKYYETKYGFQIV